MKTKHYLVVGALLSTSALFASCSSTPDARTSEAESIKNEYTAHTREVIDTAKKEGAEDVAPKSLETAEMRLKSTEEYIDANPKNISEIQKRAHDARYAAEHAVIVTRAANDQKNMTTEDHVLAMEGMQSRFSATKKEYEKEEAGEQKDMTSIDAHYKNARSLFSEEEAGVYKRTDAILIRLKGLQFKSNQAELSVSDTPLLSKVEKVIRDFGRASVIVEGHADTSGNHKMNTQLSISRAEAVKKYLLTNITDANIEVIAKGYGDSRPIATNKTAEGRAMNRRVDVLISSLQSEHRISAVTKVAE